MTKTKVAVFVSGGGTNLQTIIDQQREGNLLAEIALVVSSRPQAYALKRAQQADIPTVVCSPRDYASPDAYGQALLKLCESYKPDLIVLAGFMSILSSDFVKRYANRIMNTHPSLVPAFCGKGFYGERVHRHVLEYGVKVSGATIMFVDQDVDTGPIILQETVPVNYEDTIETLQARVLSVEHALYPQAINLFAQGRLQVVGRKVKIIEY